MKTFIVHYDKLTERKAYLDSVLDKPAYITEYGVDSFGFDKMSKIFYLPDKAVWDKQCSIYDGILVDPPQFKEMTPGMISCSIGHVMIWDYVAGQDDNVLILEDDAILCNSFYAHFSRLMKKLDIQHPDWDVFFVGGAFHHSICRTIQDEGELLKKDHPASNTVCGYVIKPRSANLLFDKIVPFSLPIDFAMNYWMKELKFNVWHANPYLIREGTSAGYYTSSQVRT